MPAPVMPVSSQVGFIVRNHHEMEGPGGDGQIASRAQVVLARGIRLNRRDSHPEKIAHNTRAMALPIASATIIRSTADVFCWRNGLKPMVER